DVAYFTRPVGDAALEEALAGASPEARTHIRRGAARSLDAYGRLWSGVQRAIVRFRQPHAVRFDGREPRGAVHELLLTAWDSVPLLRAVEARGDALRARLRPTVGDLLGRR